MKDAADADAAGAAFEGGEHMELKVMSLEWLNINGNSGRNGFKRFRSNMLKYKLITLE